MWSQIRTSQHSVIFWPWTFWKLRATDWGCLEGRRAGSYQSGRFCSFNFDSCTFPILPGVYAGAVVVCELPGQSDCLMLCEQSSSNSQCLLRNLIAILDAEGVNVFVSGLTFTRDQSLGALEALIPSLVHLDYCILHVYI